MFPLLDVTLTGDDLVDLVVVAGIIAIVVILLQWILGRVK